MKLSTIAKNIRKQRKKLGLSQDKLSKLAEVAYNTIVKIESGENSNPTVETLIKIARALNIPIDKFDRYAIINFRRIKIVDNLKIKEGIATI